MKRAYETVVSDFSVPALEKEMLKGSLAGGLNACLECCDAHVGANRVALHYESKDGSSADYTFEQLRDLSAQFANFLTANGVKPGDRISGLLPRTPELLVTILGTWRAGAVYQPLFTAFGPKAIEHRVKTAESRFVVTDLGNRSKLDGVENCPKVLCVGDAVRDGDLNFKAELAARPASFEPVPRGAEDAFLLMFTSGTTGLPKGVPVPLKALLSFGVYMRDAVDLRADDVFWNIADPGWAYGLYYAVTGPLLLGHTTMFYDGGFTVDTTYGLIAKLGITNLAGSPTAYRMLIAAGPEAAAAVKGKLRVVSSAGEPLNPEVIRWFAEHLECPINDHYGQTELGMVVNNHHGLDHPIRMGSAGLSMPGYKAVVVNEEGTAEMPVGKPGILAIDRSQSPLFWFPGYLNRDTPSFIGPYYLTGDTVEWNDDGSVSFVGRSDDIITSSGYRIGPFDVESALIEHPAVIETAVVGKPDPERTEIVKAFVVLAKGYEPSDALAEELQQHVRKRLSTHAFPREIEFVAELPKTPSGKVQRFILRNQEVAKTKENNAA
ncbi:MAG: AMP-binding protein [Zavarzinia sp.]|nr:AMP-binding protein [Zavarzinia sp.]